MCLVRLKQISSRMVEWVCLEDEVRIERECRHSVCVVFQCMMCRVSPSTPTNRPSPGGLRVLVAG